MVRLQSGRALDFTATDGLRQLLVVVVFLLCTLGVVFDDLIRCAMLPPSVDFLGGSGGCATWPTTEVLGKQVICTSYDGIHGGRVDNQNMQDVKRLVTARGRCGPKRCSLLLPNKLSGLSAAGYCDGLHVVSGRVLDQEGGCAPTSRYRSFLWCFSYMVQVFELGGFVVGVYATFRWKGFTPASAMQLQALRALLFTQVLRVSADVLLLLGFNWVVAPVLPEDDQQRVHEQLFPLGPERVVSGVGLGYFVLSFAFAALIWVLIDLDNFQRKTMEAENKPLLGLTQLNSSGRGAVRDAVRQQVRENARKERTLGRGMDVERMRGPPPDVRTPSPGRRQQRAGTRREVPEERALLDP